MKKAVLFIAIFIVVFSVFCLQTETNCVFAQNSASPRQPDVLSQSSDSEFENTLRATFSTNYSWSSPNRKHNVQLAASMLNVTLYPDEIFSFNRVVGARSIERGFKSAPIIQDGKFVEGVGGGVCQVSTTLYNCALLADLEILTVNRHTLPVSYVPSSFDAMVTSRSDLRFVNSTASPIKIRASVKNGILTVSIYGDKMTRKIVKRSVVTATLPFKTEEIEDSTIPSGTRQTVSKGKNGVRSQGYIDIYEDGKYVGSRLIRKDYYSPQTEIVAIGTKPVGEVEIDG